MRTFEDIVDSAGDTLPVRVGVADCALFVPGRGGGGRIDGMFLLEVPAGRTGGGIVAMRDEVACRWTN